MNELLSKAQGVVQGLVTDPERVRRLVKAGTTTIYDKNLFERLTSGLAESQDPASDIARGTAGVLNILSTKARGTLPDDVMLQGGMLLMIDALDFAEQSGLMQVDNAALDNATMAFMDAIAPALGKSADRLDADLTGLGQTINSRMADFAAAAGGK